MSVKYIIIDKHTGKRATKTLYKSLSSVLRAVNRLDNAYGGYRYRHVKIPPRLHVNSQKDT